MKRLLRRLPLLAALAAATGCMIAVIAVVDFTFGTIVPETSGYHAGYSYMQEQVTVDIPFAELGGYKLLARENFSIHEPYQDNFCGVHAEPSGPQTLFTVICSRQTSQAAGGYMLPTSARVAYTRLGDRTKKVDFTFGDSGVHTSGIHAGHTWLQEHVIVDDLPYASLGSYQLLIRVPEISFPGSPASPGYPATTHEPSPDNYCHTSAEPAGTGTMFTVICSRQTSEAQGGYMLNGTARLVYTVNDTLVTDFEVDTIAPNTLPFHAGHDYMQSQVELPGLPFAAIANFQLLIREQGLSLPWLPPSPGKTHEPYIDNYCNVNAAPLGTGTLMTVICSRRTSADAGGYALSTQMRLVVNTRASIPAPKPAGS